MSFSVITSIPFSNKRGNISLHIFSTQYLFSTQYFKISFVKLKSMEESFQIKMIIKRKNNNNKKEI